MTYARGFVKISLAGRVEPASEFCLFEGETRLASSFADYVERDSSAVFYTHSPLTSFLASRIAKGGFHERNTAVVCAVEDVSGDRGGYWDLVRKPLDEKDFNGDVHDLSYFRVKALKLHALKGKLSGRPVYAYYSPWNRSARSSVKRLPGRRDVFIEHGVDETFDFVLGCRKGEKRDGAYMLSFYDEAVDLLERNGISRTLEAYPFPGETSLPRPVETDNGRTWFVMGPMVEDGIASEADVKKAVSAFLDRRDKREYLVRLHPRECSVTTRIVLDAMKDAGCDAMTEEPGAEIAETAFASSGCFEAAGFYSTSVLMIGKAYDAPTDHCARELVEHASDLREFEAERLPLFIELFKL